MKIFHVCAIVRRHGAIGNFYPQLFTVKAISMDGVKDAWFYQYGFDWELHHFNGIREFELPLMEVVNG